MKIVGEEQRWDAQQMRIFDVADFRPSVSEPAAVDNAPVPAACSHWSCSPDASYPVVILGLNRAVFL